MKKIWVFIVLIGIVNLAYALDTRLYVGGELHWNFPKYQPVETNESTEDTTLKRNKYGAGLLAGVKLHENVGFEFGYNFVNKAKRTKKNNNVATVKLKSFYFDLLAAWGFHPDADLIFTVGWGRFKPSVSIENETLVNDQVNEGRFKTRVGIGAQHKIDDNLAARVMLRRQRGNLVFLTRSNQIAAGLLWYF